MTHILLTDTMTPDQLIKKHEDIISTLECLKSCNRRIQTTEENITGFTGTFPALRAKYSHQLYILTKAQFRLTKRYTNQLIKLSNTF